MKYLPRALCIAMLLTVPGPAAVASDDVNPSLVVTTEGDSIAITVPVSRIKVLIPSGNLTRDEKPGTGATSSARYFKFADSGKGLVISGWMESESSWQGWKKFFAGEFAALLKSGYPPTQAPDALKAEPWNGFTYDVDLKPGLSANLRAEGFKDGTWVDLHISVSNSGPIADARAEALALLKTIEIVRK